MKVVVSGASGFLGSHTLDLLLAKGIDALGTSRATNSSQYIKKIKSFSNMPDADILIHFAESNNRFEVNAIGNQYVTDVQDRISFLSKKYPRMIYVSSVAVYPEGASSLRSPSEKLTPFDTYSEAKLAAERIVLDSNKNPIVARIGNAYGPRMSELNVISSVLRQFISKKSKIELVSTDPVRDYIWCEDIANAFLKMCESESNGIFNVATGVGYSVLEVCQIVEKITGHTDYDIVTQKRIPNSSIVLDISKTIEQLKWEPLITLEQGLSNLIKEKAN